MPRSRSSAPLNFYPRPPRGGRPPAAAPVSSMSDFYPRPPRGGRLLASSVMEYFRVISIHALREEGDDRCRNAQAGYRISIHALREEGDFDSVYVLLSRCIFLSTPSARRATVHLDVVRRRQRFLSTPSARRATCVQLLNQRIEVISIHALREEGDNVVGQGRDLDDGFLSTPSARRATTVPGDIMGWADISIHALREEGDSKNRDKISIFL